MKQQEEIAEIFAEMAFFLELKGENPFKVRTFQNAARIIENLEEDIAQLAQEKRLGEVKGIGKGLTAAIEEYLRYGKVRECEVLRQEFPEGLVQLRQVPGLGPKKIKTLFEELGIASLSELEYACNENRLLELPGFGAKSQEKISAALADVRANQGKLLLPQAESLAQTIGDALEKHKSIAHVHRVGELRRRLPVISSLDFLLEFSAPPKENLAKLFHKELQKLEIMAEPAATDENSPVMAPAFMGLVEGSIPLRLFLWHPQSSPALATYLLELTGSSAFLESLPARDAAVQRLASEEKIFSQIYLPWIPPEARDLPWPAKKSSAPLALVEESDIRGLFHSHTTASDGANSLEEMVQRCQDLGFEYLGISEHSQSAGYAGGLKPDAILRQREAIVKLNARLKNFKIFHGIESDILKNGALDYPDKILASFDFVIASLHGNFHQPRAEITQRVCRALENPYTTWLGHPTGRLLLGRRGADFDMELILDTAARYKKSIELNANPYRLDLDWSYLPAAHAKKIPIGIFPDAHSLHGLEDYKYGVLMARKGRLTKDDIVNTKSLAEMEKWLSR